MHIKNVENGARTRKLWILQVRGPKSEGVRLATTWHRLAATRQVTEGVQSMEEDRFDSPRRGHHLPRRGTPQKCPINRFQGLRVPFLSSLLSRAKTLRLCPRDPPKAPVFHLQVPKEGFVFPRFPRFPRIPRFPAFSTLPVEVLLDSSLDYFKSTSSIK